MDEVDLKKFNVVINVSNLTEAVVDEQSRNVLIKVIEKGWSNNGNYYDEKIVESFVGHLLEKKKMYTNHLLRQNQGDYIGRDMRDWSAQISEAYTENGATYAKIHVFESDEWLLERIRKCPEEVGVSIDARAMIQEGTADGKSGRLVKEIIKFNSADFVLNPAAKGRAMRLVAGVPDNLDVEDPMVVFEALKSMDEYVNSEYKKFYRLTSGFTNYLWHLMGEMDRSNVSEDDMKKALNKGFNDFKKEMMNLDFAKVYVYEAVQEHGKDAVSNIIKEISDNDEFISGDKKGVKESNKELNNNEEGEIVMDINQLKKDHPDLVTVLEAEFTKKLEKDGELTTVKEENKQLKEDAKTVDVEMVKLRKENDDYKVKEQVAEKKGMVEKKLSESKISKEYITDKFRETLMGLKEAKDVDAHIKEREELILKASGKIKDVGEPPEDLENKKEKKDVKEGEDDGISDEKAKEILNRKE
jgi:hypothetical protein